MPIQNGYDSTQYDCSGRMAYDIVFGRAVFNFLR